MPDSGKMKGDRTMAIRKHTVKTNTMSFVGMLVTDISVSGIHPTRFVS